MTARANPVDASVAAVGRLARWWTRWLRSALTLALGVFAVVCLVLSAITVWADSVLFDSNSVASAAGDALADPEAIAALATDITDQVFAALDVDSRLRDRLASISGVGSSGAVVTIGTTAVSDLVTNGAHDLVESQLADALARPVVRETVERGLSAAHGALLAVLDGDDDQVVLDATPVAALAITALQQFGLFDGIEVPELLDGTRAERLLQLADALDVSLPPEFGAVVLYRESAVDRASGYVQLGRDLVVLVRRASAAVLVLTVVSLAGAVVLARHRRRAVVVLAIGTVVVAGLSRVLLARIVERAPDLLSDHSIRIVVQRFLANLTGGLATLLALLVLVALAAAVAGVSVGRGSARRR